MRLFLRILLVAALTWVLGMQAPMYPIIPPAVGAFFIGLMLSQSQKKQRLSRKKPPRAYAFIAGFIGMGAVWTVMAIIANQTNDGDLTGRMAEILMQNGAYGWVLVALTGLLGGLLGGFSTMSGNLLGEAVKS